MDNFLPGTNEVFLIVIYVFFTQTLCRLSSGSWHSQRRSVFKCNHSTDESKQFDFAQLSPPSHRKVIFGFFLLLNAVKNKLIHVC